MMTIRVANQRVQSQVLCDAEFRPSCTFMPHKKAIHYLPDIRQGMSRLTKLFLGIIFVDNSL